MIFLKFTHEDENHFILKYLHKGGQSSIPMKPGRDLSLYQSSHKI